MDKLNILAISYLFPNTSQPNHGIFVFNRLNALSQYVNIKVINPIPWSPIHRYIGQYKTLESVPFHTKRGNLEIYHPRFLSIPKMLKGIELHSYRTAVNRVLSRELKTYSFDLVDLHWTFPDLPAGVALAHHHNTPAMVTLRGLEAFHQNDPGPRKSIVQAHLAKVDHLIALSNELKEASIALGADSNRHTVIRNGVNTTDFFYKPLGTCRKQLNLNPNDTIIVMVGSLIRRKGFDVVIRALSTIKESNELNGKPINLYIIGSEGPEGDFRQQLHKLINETGMREQIVFQGPVPNHQLVDWYNAADLFCLASRGEGSPNVLTEALACGCPAIATDVGAVNDILACEPTLEPSFPTDDIEATHRTIVQALSNEYDRPAISNTFRHFSWDWCANQVLSVYQSVIDKDKRLVPLCDEADSV
jgi:glycosyltransferase involved in cell wall biosynthesis